MYTCVPSLAAFLSSRPFGTCFIKPFAHVSTSLLVNLLLSRVQVVLCFGAFEAFFVSIFQNLFHTCLLWHRQLSSLPAVRPLFCCLFTCLLLALLMRFSSESFLYPDACVLSLAPIPGFGSRVTSTLVGFFSPESPSSTSCYFRASAARSIDLAQRKAPARVSPSTFFTTCSSGCGSVSFACSSSAILG